MVDTNTPVPASYHVWLVEQDRTRLFGEYLTEAMVIARTEREALDAVCSLADPVRGFGLVVRRSRPRVGSGTDDGPPADRDVNEI